MTAETQKTLTEMLSRAKADPRFEIESNASANQRSDHESLWQFMAGKLLDFYDTTIHSRFGALEENVAAGDAKYASQKEIYMFHCRDLTTEQIVYGCNNLKGNFPPSPETFRTWCFSKDSTHQSAAYSPFDKSRALEHRADPTFAKDKLKTIKEMLRK